MTPLSSTIWRQLGASIDMLENAITVCPESLWSDPTEPPRWVENGVVGVWHVAYHALFFLDLQLHGSDDGFHPPPPFDLSELDPEGRLPDGPYTKEEVLTYVAHCRRKCRDVVLAMTEERAAQMCKWGSVELTRLESLLYTMRHVQHHAGQLNLLLRQHTDSAPRWVKQTAH